MALIERVDKNENAAPATWHSPEMLITYAMLALALVPAMLAIVFSKL